MNRFLSFLVRLYPQRVRTEHGEEMRQLLNDLQREEGGIRFFTACRLAWDTMRMLPASHAHEIAAGPQLITVQGFREASFFMMKWIVLGFIGLALLFYALLFTVEAYVPFAPYIDTQFSQGFSWENYKKIQPGMTKGDVSSRLGSPLSHGGMYSGYFGIKSGKNLEDVDGVCWGYSDDGGFPYWDFAWIQVNVCFNEAGIVTGKNEIILYN